MTRTRALLLIVLIAALLPTLHTPTASAQQTLASLTEKVSAAERTAPAPAATVGSARIASASPFERPEKLASNITTDTDGSLLLQIDGKRTSLLGQYAFTAPSSFYSPNRTAFNRDEWNSDLAGGVTAFLNSTATSAVRVTGELLTYGEKRQLAAAGAPGGQAFTLEGEFVRVAGSRLGPLEIAEGGYWQKLAAYGAYANSPVTEILQGYSGSERGFQTKITVPDRNLVFLFRYGSEHVGAAYTHSRVATFQLSWTW
jgi:hypothetical protein